MKNNSILFALLGAFVLTVPAKAQIFTVGTFTDDSILSSIGSSANEVAGANFNAGPTETINGYLLTSTSSGGNGDPIDLSGYGAGFSGFLGGNGNGVLTTTGDSDFDFVVGSGAYSTQTGVITINDLTAGTYEVLVLSDDDRTDNSGATDVSLEDNSKTSESLYGGFPGGTGNPSSPGAATNQFEGAYLTDTFTVAPGQTSHTLTFNGAYVNAILVESVPEPSTDALLGMGLAVLVVALRRRSARL